MSFSYSLCFILKAIKHAEPVCLLALWSARVPENAAYICSLSTQIRCLLWESLVGLLFPEKGYYYLEALKKDKALGLNN
jgi:hypothetical protein